MIRALILSVSVLTLAGIAACTTTQPAPPADTPPPVASGLRIESVRSTAICGSGDFRVGGL